jgi:hypothetical protein
MIANALIIIGLACLVLAAFTVAFVIGLVAAGLALIIIAGLANGISAHLVPKDKTK